MEDLLVAVHYLGLVPDLVLGLGLEDLDSDLEDQEDPEDPEEKDPKGLKALGEEDQEERDLAALKEEDQVDQVERDPKDPEEVDQEGPDLRSFNPHPVSKVKHNKYCFTFLFSLKIICLITISFALPIPAINE